MFRLFKKKPKSLVLVDVDGTISPSSYPVTSSDYYFSEWNGGHHFSAVLKEELQALPAKKMWLTGWGDSAEETFECGWETLDSERSSDAWKVDALEEYLKSHKFDKVVWFDDETDKWAWEIAQKLPGVITITTDASKGLTWEDLEVARAILNS